MAAHASVEAIPLAGLGSRRFDVVINATSAGLTGDVALPWPSTIFAPGAFAYDIVYSDAPTLFLRFATAAGVTRSADGLGMLIEQAALGFELWRGVRPDTAPVFALLRPQRR
jgi:shikimate dehydrogenase